MSNNLKIPTCYLILQRLHYFLDQVQLQQHSVPTYQYQPTSAHFKVYLPTYQHLPTVQTLKCTNLRCKISPVLCLVTSFECSAIFTVRQQCQISLLCYSVTVLDLIAVFAALLQIHWRESSQSLPALGEMVSYESEN